MTCSSNIAITTITESHNLDSAPIGAGWPLASDHLPIGMELWGLRFASWNVLNKTAIHHLLNNREGLAESSLVTENVPSPQSPSLTVRELKVLKVIDGFIKKFDLIALQECGPEFLEALQLGLPEGYLLLRGLAAGSANDCCIVLNSASLSLSEDKYQIISDGFQCKPTTPIFNLLLCTNQGSLLRLIHTHVPGNPKLPGVTELAEFLRPQFLEPIDPTIVCGDLNFPEAYIRQIFETQQIPEFQAIKGNGNCNTVIGLDRTPKRIDHFLFFSVSKISATRPLAAQFFGPEAQAAAEILG